MAKKSDLPSLPSGSNEINEHFESLPPEAPADTLQKALKAALPKIRKLGAVQRTQYLKYIKRQYGLTDKDLAEIEAEGKPGRVVGYKGGNVQKFAGRYVFPIGDGEYCAISNFVLEPREYVRVDGKDHVVADIVSANGPTTPRALFPISAFRSRRAFVHHLPSVHQSFIGDDNQVESILRVLAREKSVPTLAGTKAAGYVETERGPLWVAPGVVLAPNGPTSDAGVTCIANTGNGSLPGRLKYKSLDAPAVQNLAAQVMPLLVMLNAPQTILTVLGWTFAAMCKPAVQKILGHFPHLLVWARMGGGKTTLLKLVWRMFGVANTNPYSVTNTQFPLLEAISSTTSIPVFFDEYKPRDMKPQQVEFLHRLLRRAYDGESERRGRPDQSLVEYALTAPIMMAGESRPQGDEAVLERLLEVSPERDYLRAHPESVDACRRLQRLPLEQLAAPLACFALEQDVPAGLERADAETRAMVEKILAARSNAKGIEVTIADVPARRLDALCVMVFGLGVLTRFSDRMKVQLPELQTAAAIEYLLDRILDGGRTSRDAFDEFLAALSIYSRGDKLVEGEHYAYIGKRLRLHLQSRYDVYLRERKSAGLGDDTNGLPALKLLIAEKIRAKSYVVRDDERALLRDHRPRCIEIDVEQAEALIDFEPFAHNQERTHGGRRERGSSDQVQYGASTTMGGGTEPNFDDVDPPPTGATPPPGKRPVA